MTELKTLKDLEKKQGGHPFVFTKDLKQEAIKWVKKDFELVRNLESHKMLERWKNRFNLTEEDLK